MTSNNYSDDGSNSDFNFSLPKKENQISANEARQIQSSSEYIKLHDGITQRNNNINEDLQNFPENISSQENLNIINEPEQIPNKIKMPDDTSKLKHIFRNKEGHLIDDTQENRILFETLANDNTKSLGTDESGNTWNAITYKDNSQLWVECRDNKIIDAGKNSSPRQWNPKTGLKNPNKPIQAKNKQKI